MDRERFASQIEDFRRHLEDLRGATVSPTTLSQDELLLELGTSLEELQVAEEELRQQNEELMATQRTLEMERRRYRDLFDLSPDGYLVTNPSGIIRQANPAAATLLQVSQDELRNVPIAVFVAQEDQRAFGEWLSEAREAGQVRTIDVRFQSSQRPAFFASLRVAPVAGEEGRALLWTVRDISRAKEAEASLTRSRDELEHRVEERTRDLSRSNQELEDFARAASHDLQEPLRTITGFLQILQKRYAGKLDEEAEHFFGFAADGAARMKDLITDLLEYARVGTVDLSTGTMDLREAVEKARKSLGAAIEETQAKVEYNSLPAVQANPSQMAQLFQNLIGNAVKFRGPRPPVIRIEASREGGKWVISVSDNGIGIDPQMNERIFQVFKRLHTREEYQGTGVGLAICRRIVERHGGHIWVESEPGNGSTFFFTLPPASV